MRIVRYSEAMPYNSPGHFDMSMVRLQGYEAGETKDFWIGVSTIEPGGGTARSSSPQEKMYVILNGELEFDDGRTTAAIGRWDSCRFAPGEDRQLRNKSGSQATVLLVMSLSRSVGHEASVEDRKSDND